jgi:class 3 adenylate cyclase
MRAVLPSGQVTLLLTDIEGSTRLLQDLGAERFAEVLAAVRAVIRDAVSRFDGVEVDAQGDAFFIAFASAANAVTDCPRTKHSASRFGC